MNRIRKHRALINSTKK